MKKAVIIGIDGGTWKLLKPWMEWDKLPLFKKIFDESIDGTLINTVPSIVL